jgi:hypothetical protein
VRVVVVLEYKGMTMSAGRVPGTSRDPWGTTSTNECSPATRLGLEHKDARHHSPNDSPKGSSDIHFDAGSIPDHSDLQAFGLCPENLHCRLVQGLARHVP